MRNVLSFATGKLFPHASETQHSITGCTTSNLTACFPSTLTGYHSHQLQLPRSLVTHLNTNQTLKPQFSGPFGQLQPAESFQQIASNRSASFSTSAMPRVLVTFDVDGTLMRAVGEEANKLHKKAFSFAMKEVCGVDGTIDAIHVSALPERRHFMFRMLVEDTLLWCKSSR